MEATSRREPPLQSTPASVLTARTQPIDRVDPFTFLAEHEGSARVLHWTARGGVAGAGCAVEIAAQGPGRFDEIQRAARTWDARIVHEREPGVPATIGPRWIGGFAFSDTTEDAEFPGARFVLAQEQILVEDGRAYRTTMGPPGGVKPGEERARMARAPVVWRNDPGFETWATRVRGAIEAIRNGTVEKIVLARRIGATLADAPPLPRLLRALAGRSPAGRVFLVEPRPGVAFLGASPELLLERRAERVRTVALAGSRMRGRTDAEDAALARALLASSKEAWEHEIVARFLRAAFTKRGLPWSSPAERTVVRLPNVQHIETRFEAPSDPGESILDLAARLHPTPAVGGSPSEAALRLIERLEETPRGWYAGPVGWFDAEGDGELTVGIRSASVREREVVLHAGCGIVEGSDPAEEWAESRTKFQLLADAFEAEAST